MRFVVLRKSEKWMESGAPDPELVAAMQRFDDEMRQAGVLVAVERLQPSSNATRLRMSKGEFRTVDGPFTETNELIAGVNILEVASKEEAIAWMKRCPTLCGHSTEAEFEIRPVLEAPGE
ncbi:MAG TPA: YciI family protein [Acidobacteriaceae bacterium]